MKKQGEKFAAQLALGMIFLFALASFANAGDWRSPWSSEKSDSAKQCAKVFDSFQLQAVCMQNEKTGYGKMQGNFGMPSDVAEQAKERCARIFDTFQLQAVCMENERKGYEEMKKY